MEHFENQIRTDDGERYHEMSNFDSKQFQSAFETTSYFTLQAPSAVPVNNSLPENSDESSNESSTDKKYQDLVTVNRDDQIFKKPYPVPPKATRKVSNRSPPTNLTSSSSPFPDAPFPEFEKVFSDAYINLRKGNYVEAFQKARMLNRKLREKNAYDTQAYIHTIKLITRILCVQGKLKDCCEFLLNVSNATSRFVGKTSSICLISRMLAAHLKTNVGNFQLALEDYEKILQSIESEIHSNTFKSSSFSYDQHLEVLHAKAALQLVLGMYEESLITYNKISAELERIGKANLEQVSLVLAKVSLVLLKHQEIGNANQIAEDVLIMCQSNKSLMMHPSIFQIATFVKWRWSEIERTLRCGEHVSNFAGDFLPKLNERGVNIFVGLEPKEWDLLFGRHF